jgi:hypothetical protein
VDGKVCLGPAPLFAEPTHALSESQTNIFSCHALSMAVFFGLHFAYRIQLRSQGNRRRTLHVWGGIMERKAVLG